MQIPPANAICDTCHQINQPTWGRSQEVKDVKTGKVTTKYICKICWEIGCTSVDNPDFIKIPTRVNSLFGWVLSDPLKPATLAPGDYEIGIIDAYTDVVTLWAYPDELQLVSKELPSYLMLSYINNMTDILFKSRAGREESYFPFVTLLSFVKQYCIFYRKDTGDTQLFQLLKL